MFFWSVFLKTHNKILDRQKLHIGIFWPLKKVFLSVFKNTDQNNIYGFIIFKAKTKQKYEENFFKGFYSKLKNALLGGQPDFYFLIFFST